ncbi:hypothetical protein J2T13_001603 [Paenibacillus sp. DS2015]|uniref:DUF3891 family protein n=1 Tax=Paenibacillus sp. DS2015 TaxID=3373917 RepID=UPI003D1C767D
MICRELKEAWVMIEQHQHGLIAGQFAKAFNSKDFLESIRKDEAIFAIYEHDRGWIDLDDTPFLNTSEDTPYTFLDFPIVPKLAFYTKGLDEVQAISPYGALLCSLHYEKLLIQAELQHPAIRKYMEQERLRRDHIQEQLGIIDLETEGELIYHLSILQLCDDLSLYLCLNEPGSDKEHEHPWWRDGFTVSEKLNLPGGEMMQANWIDRNQVKLTPFSFESSLTIELPCRYVSKSDIQKLGLSDAYAQSEEVRHRFEITAN